MNVKRLLALVLQSAAVGASAQTYDSLWKQAEQAMQNDLPQTVIEHVDAVMQKAQQEKNEAQLLRAFLMRTVWGYQIDPDSVRSYLTLIQHELQNETNPVDKALWHSALAQTYEQIDAFDPQDDLQLTPDSVRQHFEASLAEASNLIGVPVAPWLPLMKPGKDSRLFANDVLHVLLKAYVTSDLMTDADKGRMLERMATLYEQHGQPDAALLLRIDRLNLLRNDTYENGSLAQNPLFAQYLELAQKNADNPLNVRTYNALTEWNYDADSPSAADNDSLLVTLARKALTLYAQGKEMAESNHLRNFLTQMQTPRAQLKAMPEELYPGSTCQLSLQVRNLKEVKLRITPLYDSAADYDKAEAQRNQASPNFGKLAQKNRGKSKEQSIRPAAAAAWKWQHCNVDFVAPQAPGVYWAELVVDGKTRDAVAFSVSALRPLVFSSTPGQNRVVVVDSQTGKPVPGVKITSYATQKQWQKLRTYQTNEQGEADIVMNGTTWQTRFYASTTSDAAASHFKLSDFRSNANPITEKTATHIDLFTDRAIYRPGQEVQFSTVVYSHEGDAYRTLENFEAKVTLYNVNRKAIDSLLVKTDAYGQASGKFRLPEAALPGQFYIELTNRSVHGYCHFKVEAYKRPTFTAETQPLTTAYALGDSVRVAGQATTYSGVPVAGARVKYSVERSLWMRWNTNDFVPQTGETTTDAEGRFTLPVSLLADEKLSKQYPQNRYYFTVNYDVTAENGETVSGSTTLVTASYKAVYEADLPQTLCKESLPKACISLKNAGGRLIDAPIPFKLQCPDGSMQSGQCQSGKRFDLSPLLAGKASGIYRLELPALQGAKADTLRLVLFSETDKRPVDKDVSQFVYTRTSEAKDSAFVLIGSPKHDVNLYYHLVTNRGIVESKRYTLTDSLLHFSFAYKPEYGDAATAYFAFVRDGQIYSQSVSVVKPTPDKRLLLKWKTFRSRVTPGQHEEWQLQVTYPDGKPAESNVMACLYDASLDALAQSQRDFSRVDFYRTMPRAAWYWNNFADDWRLTLEAQIQSGKLLNLYVPRFTQWNPELFNYYGTGNIVYDMTAESMPELGGAMPRKFAVRSTADRELTGAVPQMMARKVGMQNAAPTSAGNAAKVRANFAETAFFRPALRTNDRGEVSIAFTLPESLTEWRFNALAHDRQMNYGSLDTTVVARKDFMVQPALPRFVRRGDRIELPVQVTNLTDNTQHVKVVLTLANALNENHNPLTLKQELTVEATQTAVCTFTYENTSQADMLVCRVTGESGAFSDGEEHYLPVLDERTEVTRTLPFTLHEAGETTLRIDTLFDSKSATQCSLTVEVASNPTWYAVSALPVLAGNACSISATEWATRFYALALGQQVASSLPDVSAWLKQHTNEVDVLAKLQGEGLTDDTPWLQRQMENQQRTKNLKRLFDEEWNAANRITALGKLKDLQREDGAWSWYPGMPGNDYITTDVAILLARIDRLTPNDEGKQLLLKALAYLKKQTAKQVKQMEQVEKKSGHKMAPTELQLRYLYLLTLVNEKADHNVDFILQRMALCRRELTMYGKALSAICLDYFKQKAESELTLQSLMEYTVASPEKGRWFNTPRAEWSWNAYRIPTQCAAIEALTHFDREADAYALRLWLLQAKRTQMWETSRATADAVYALLMSANAAGSPVQTQKNVPVGFALKKGRKVVATQASAKVQAPHSVGYFKHTFTDPSVVASSSIQLDKSSGGLSWGSVYATFTLPETEVKTEGRELHIARTFEVKRGNRWMPLKADGVKLTKGDRIRQVLTLKADRDFDFVRVDASRPGCLEPAAPLSGYVWNESLPAYRVVRDAATDFFIEKVSKGTHRLTEELFVTRSGLYATGISRITSEFAPEFCGTAASDYITVE